MSKESSLEYYHSNKEKVSQKRKDRYRGDPELRRRTTLKAEKNRRLRLYGITEEDYLNLLFQHKGACGICKKSFTKTPHIDHDHKTGKVRGLLCPGCNAAIGLLGEDSTRFRWAAEYLEGSQPHTEGFGSWYKWLNKP